MVPDFRFLCLWTLFRAGFAVLLTWFIALCCFAFSSRDSNSVGGLESLPCGFGFLLRLLVWLMGIAVSVIGFHASGLDGTALSGKK